VKVASPHTGGSAMNNIVYIVGAVVIVIVILGFLGLR
jgi:LPXTG-motif cell wall-anchored protein